MPAKKQSFNTIFYAYYFLKVHINHFSKIKSQKESQTSGNQGFSYYFCMMIEGSGSRAGSIPLTSGSGPGRPKNMWIRWIWIRIRNTASHFDNQRVTDLIFWIFQFLTKSSRCTKFHKSPPPPTTTYCTFYFGETSRPSAEIFRRYVLIKMHTADRWIVFCSMFGSALIWLSWIRIRIGNSK
jgi:hypothetical protein